MHIKSIQVVLSICLVLTVCPPSRAEPIRWSGIIGADSAQLSRLEKSRVVKNLKHISNTRGCVGTLAECLGKGDLTARRHAGFVVRMVKKAKTDAFIQKGIDARHRSAHSGMVSTLDLGDSPTLGDRRAPVTVVEFACFQCPFCAHLAAALKMLRKRFGTKLSFVFKFFPVRSHPRGVAAAVAALAAHRQGQFWPMYHRLFEHRADLADADLIDHARALKLDLKKFERDVSDPAALERIQADKLEGMGTGVEGTPAFFVNGKQYMSLNTYAEIVDRIEEELDIVEGRIR